MEIINIKNKILPFFQKYKYVILIILLGIILMMIPEKKKVTSVSSPIQSVNHLSVQDDLEDILSHVKGSGKVKVMLIEAKGAETIYETNSDQSETDSRTEIVTVTDANRNENGLVKQVNPPKYGGAVVLCQGAADPNVRLAITDAVSKVTGLGADKIAVLIMK